MLKWNKKRYQYDLYPHKVKYTNSILDRGEVTIRDEFALPDVDWWVGTANRHKGKIDIIEFYDIEITPQMQERYDAIKNFDDVELATQYILGEELTQEQIDSLIDG